MGQFHFAVGRVDEAEELVKRFHYSRRVPANVQVCATMHQSGGLFGDLGDVVAACFFSIPPTRWSEDVLELSRLVRREDIKIQLTGLIAKACDFIHRKNLADLLVSFADAGHGHHGGIYQAASWCYHEQRESRMDGLVVDGQFIPGRSSNSRWGTRSPSLLATRLGDGHVVEGHWDIGKHLYWRPLARSGVQKAKRLGLQKLAYPKPDLGGNHAAADEGTTTDISRLSR